MKRSVLWLSLCIIALAGAALSLFLGKTAATFGCIALVFIFLIFLYRSTALPMRAIRSGMDLLRSQDLASRLRKVGQKEADEVIDLYNTVITNMKAERLKTLEQENFLGSLIEASPMGIAICDFDGNIEKVNPAFKAMSSQLLQETLASLGPNEETTIRPGGTQVLHCSRRSFMDRGFSRPFFLVERMTDEIMKAETDMFHKIVRTMGHEVNNTLGGVVSVLETLADINAGDKVIVEAIDSCRNSCINLEGFVRGYSDVVKLPEPVTEPLAINSLITDVLPFLRSMCPQNIAISPESDPEGATVMADPMLLQRVIVNAVKNSAESIGDSDGHIVLRTSGKKLEIVDDGRGISPENAANIFTPFFSTKRADRGLGLMLISDILRKHKAEFSLVTGNDGLTRFSIIFK